jgi:hypothetical protein
MQVLTDFFPPVGLPIVDATESLSLRLAFPFAGEEGTVNLVDERVESGGASVLVRDTGVFPYLNSI